MKYRLLTALTTLMLGVAGLQAQSSPECYRLYDQQGKTISFETMMTDLASQDVVFVGEMHNCALCHWLERHILQTLHAAHGKRLAVGMEMLEADNQLIIDEYQQGLITADRFETEMRLWPNHDTDYAPLVDYACEHGLQLVATNVPRRYANAVKNHGLGVLDSLSNAAKAFLPPLPIAYQSNAQANEGFSLMAMMGKGKGANPEWLAQSQALKDATMAWHIVRWLNSGEGAARRMVHFNGNYHTAGGEGIITYLKQYSPAVKCKTIYAVRQEDITQLEEGYLGQGDYYICVTEDFSTSY